MSDLPPLPQAPLGRYVHYKGGEYEVVGVVRHSETLEPLVLYRPLYNESGLWVRPYAMFFERIEVEGRRSSRFSPAHMVDRRKKLIEEAAALPPLDAAFLIVRFNERENIGRVFDIRPEEVAGKFSDAEYQRALTRVKALRARGSALSAAVYARPGTGPYEPYQAEVAAIKRDHPGFSEKIFELVFSDASVDAR